MKKTLVVVAALCALAAAGCSAKTGGGTANRPPLQLPDASTFKTGTCATIADPVLALGRFTYENAGATKLTDEHRAELVVQGQKLVDVKDSASPEMQEMMMDVLMHIGYVRIRTGKTYDPQLLTDVETARQKLQTSCTT
jgi:hypothetical protein